MLKNIIFDVDGTLVDSKRDIAAAQHWVLQQLGVDSHTPEELYPLIGKPLTETFATLLPPSFHHRIAEAAELYKTYYPPRALETTTATTKLSAGTRRVLQHFGIAEYFAQIQGSDEMPFKPDPFIIMKILKDQAWERGKTLMVGDTDNDIQAGKRANIPTCGVTYGSLTSEQMSALEPDFIIDSLPQLLVLL